MDTENLDKLIESCLSELVSVKEGNFDVDKADRVAAMFLEAQMRLSTYMEEVDFKAKAAKNEISRIEAVKYFEFKKGQAKTTENSLSHEIAKDDSVVDIKNKAAKFESEVKKYNSILMSLKDGHVYFRTINKLNNKPSWD